MSAHARFIQELEQLLRNLPEEEKREIIYDFNEHFELGLEEGKTEEEIASELGSPKLIAKEILANYHVTKAETNHSLPNITRAVLATVGLSFFNLVFLLGPVVAIIGVMIGLFAAAFSLVISGIVVFFTMFNQDLQHVMFKLFSSFTLVGLGLLIGVSMVYTSKSLYKVLLKYIKFNLRVAKGE